ncbi:unnamed protein product (macronuclear) [Paramecium tetraurelia]|uniref:FPL domain-containing protein n=1 Tax=Paramecium tetraurelia TaxID=5888 RepID=A0CMJ6_PARTE|nr:uncharacterized protein GSPATT00008492001 [Paramecium tetraurelia]CAK72013.1 unnamed protein product [Paramecium tetraurelia]|eukprot:XP_001439410.1 hypothetical protein (macronuclear) [Paramecium tetraurelia strain d4-2]
MPLSNIPHYLTSYLAENNILALFYEKIFNLTTRQMCSINFKLSFIIQNVKKPLNITYLISHPVLNDFINYKYDFSNHEMVDYYVNFLKSIAIRIDRENFFLHFNLRYSTFPLLWQAQKFINYPDTLVSSTVKVIILSLSKLFDIPQDGVALTQSIIKQENKSIKKFKNYLTLSPFCLAYQKYVHQMKCLLPNLAQVKSQDQLEDLIMFFSDFLQQCPFLIPLFEQIMLDQLILPILDYLLLNKLSDFRTEFKLGFYLIHQIISKLPVNEILKYFSQDMIPKDTGNRLKYNYIPSATWVYETENYPFQFEQTYFKKANNQNEIGVIENQPENNLINNYYKLQMLQLLKPRDNSILLLQLAIWHIIKNHQQPWPVNHIIQLISKPQNQIKYTKKIIDLIIQFYLNEDTNKLKDIYLEYENYIKQLIANIKSGKAQLSEALIINWGIIEDFDWNLFKKSQTTISNDDFQNWERENELSQFKLVYTYLLLKFLVMNNQKEPSKTKIILNQEISHLTDDQYFKIDKKRTYLIISIEKGYVFQTIPCSNPNRGVVTFIYPLAGLICTQEADYLKFEQNQLAINQAKPNKIEMSNNLIDEIISKINDSKIELEKITLDKLEQLIK